MKLRDASVQVRSVGGAHMWMRMLPHIREPVGREVWDHVHIRVWRVARHILEQVWEVE